MDSPSSRDGLRPGATVLLLLLAGLLTFAAYRICAIAVADHYARSTPARALRWVAGHPEALAALSRLQLAASQDVAAASTARKLLRHSPADGEGFELLARVSERAGNNADALRLMRIAARRKPRDLAVRGWLAERAISRGDYGAGLDQLEAVMRLSPIHVGVVVPVIAELAEDPGFASIVSDRLLRRPRWGSLLVDRLSSDPEAGVVLARLAYAMDAGERRDWVERLLARHRWGEAYATWASGALAPGDGLPLLFDAGFTEGGDQGAFGWEVAVAREPSANGIELHVDRVQPGAAWLSQRLLLPAGLYRFSARVDEQAALGQGLAKARWMVECNPGGILLGETQAIDGPGKGVPGMEFSVPPGCPVQRLRLAADPTATPAPVSLRYHVGEIVLARLDPAPARSRTLVKAADGLVLAGNGDGMYPVTVGQYLPAGGRLLVAAGASAVLSFAEGCKRRVLGPVVEALPLSCRGNARPTPVPASVRIGGMHLRDRIAEVNDPRGPIPAGR